MTSLRREKVMNATHWKRSVVAGSALVLALSPLGLQQASAAAPSRTDTSASAGVHKAVENQRDYQRGFREGYRDGYGDARDDCERYGGRYGYGGHHRDDYTRGYADGYNAGFARAERRYC
ncbi:hypothetical protein AB5J52_06670 [Streptomyces sp. R39]|uniref:Uncharacterized protein n=1 Tax=Streptomyces sp. R39 TaxID=3238631 RepID=A0AB39QHT4_9ACTN|nr:hypothetical protein [Streptomyces shenzhenensis]